MPKIIADDDVYRAALHVLSENGYAGATTRKIAEEAGVNEVTLFRKYGSKPELILAAIQNLAFTVPEGAISYTGDLRQDLIRAAEAYDAGMERDGHLMPTILAEMPRHPELRAAASAPHALIREIAALLTQYQHEGALSTTEDPLQAVASFLGPLIVVRMLQGASPALAPRSLSLSSHVDRYIAGRQPR